MREMNQIGPANAEYQQFILRRWPAAAGGVPQRWPTASKQMSDYDAF
jgi:hypothetical protein